MHQRNKLLSYMKYASNIKMFLVKVATFQKILYINQTCSLILSMTCQILLRLTRSTSKLTTNILIWQIQQTKQNRQLCFLQTSKMFKLTLNIIFKFKIHKASSLEKFSIIRIRSGIYLRMCMVTVEDSCKFFLIFYQTQLNFRLMENQLL